MGFRSRRKLGQHGRMPRRLLTQAEYARHRNCSRQSVGEALAAGRLAPPAVVVSADGTLRIDPVAADAMWAARTRLRIDAPAPRAAGRGRAARSAAEVEAAREYREASARLIAAQADMARLKLGLATGELIYARDAESALAARCIAFRDRMLSIPDRTAPVLSGVTDTAEAESILRAELMAALDLLDPDCQWIDALPKRNRGRQRA